MDSRLSTAVRVAFDAGMYFRFGRMARGGVVAKSCFDAILSGERTSTTRFEEDCPAQYRQWKQSCVGDFVRVWSGPWRGAGFTGRSCVIEITSAPHQVDIRTVNREAWSLAEGWAPEFLDVLIGMGKTCGMQVRFRLHSAPTSGQMTLF